jgi:hypothetical protein
VTGVITPACHHPLFSRALILHRVIRSLPVTPFRQTPPASSHPHPTGDATR